MTRMINGDAVKRRILDIVETWKYQGRKYDALLLESVIAQIVDTQPTLTPPNEWVKVMEAINNAAVAYIEGGPYDNDLPGMEFALKIDRLSRDFVRPPEGEVDA